MAATYDGNHARGSARRRIGAGLGIACAAALFLRGCQNDRRVIHGETFPADGEKRDVDLLIDVQSAAAARADATLTAAHFDGDGGINSLGRQKLDLMLRDDEGSAAPLVVYLDVRQNGAAGSGSTRPASLARHEETVLAYLSDQGVDARNVELRGGPNEQFTRPA